MDFYSNLQQIDVILETVECAVEVLTTFKHNTSLKILIMSLKAQDKYKSCFYGVGTSLQCMLT